MDFWYYLQQSHVRKAAHLGNRTLSDGVDIYRAMLEDTMQTAKPQLIEVMENYKVCINFEEYFHHGNPSWYGNKFLRLQHMPIEITLIPAWFGRREAHKNGQVLKKNF